jgi:hypothetical protein
MQITKLKKPIIISKILIIFNNVKKHITKLIKQNLINKIKNIE